MDSTYSDDLLEEGMRFNYHGYEGSYLPADLLNELFKDNRYALDWDAEEVIQRLHKRMPEVTHYHPEKGLQLNDRLQKITVKGKTRLIRPLFYYLTVGFHPVGGYYLGHPEDNRNSIEPERLHIVDRRIGTRNARTQYNESRKRAKEITEGGS